MMEAEIVWEPVYKTGRYQLAVRDPLTHTDFVRPAIFDRAPAHLDSVKIVAAGMILTFGQPLSFNYSSTLLSSVVQKWESLLMLEHSFSLVDGLYSSSNFTDLSVRISPSLGTETPSRDQTVLGLFPSERFYGGFQGIKEAYVASNIWMMESENQVKYQLASGVLFANELMARSIRISEDMSLEFAATAQHLLESIGLDLKTDL